MDFLRIKRIAATCGMMCLVDYLPTVMKIERQHGHSRAYYTVVVAGVPMLVVSESYTDSSFSDIVVEPKAPLTQKTVDMIADVLSNAYDKRSIDLKRQEEENERLMQLLLTLGE